MTTPNSPDAKMVDVHADPDFTRQFDVEPGDQILGASTARESAGRLLRPGCNVGRTEQKIRLAAGVALVAAAAVAPIPRGWRLAMAALGAAELITGSTRHCPLWDALGVNTCRAGEE